MFLDPEPRKPRHTAMPSSNSTPALLPSRKSTNTTTDSQRDLHRTAVKRKPLHERTKSQNNSRPSSRDRAEKTTVRLIDSSSSLYSSRENSNPDDFREGTTGKGARGAQDSRPPPLLSPLKPGKDGITRLDFSGEKTGSAVPRAVTSVDAVQPRIVEIPASSSPEPPKAPWHRRSGSSGVTSDASTLYLRTAADGSVNPGPRRSTDEKHHSRTSLGTTLRGTPTPYEQDREDEEEVDTGSHLQPLQTLTETSPERTYIANIKASEEPRSDRLSRFEDSPTRGVEPQTPLLVVDEAEPTHRAKRKRKSASTGSLPKEADIFRPGDLATAPTQESFISVASSDVFNSPPSASPNLIAYGSPSSDFTSDGGEGITSSPNYVAYSSPSVQPRSSTRRLQGAPSFDSIESRLHYPARGRSETIGTLAERSSVASGQSSRPDSLPPLHVPKKNSAQAKMAAALREAVSSGNSGEEDDEEIDTLPYPRQAFSMHLSTIASESDRTGSRHWSQFSTGSGILTGGEESSNALPTRTWRSPPLSESASRNWMESSQDPLPVGFSSDEEDSGDMTLGIFREESAKPLPLFKERRGGERAGPSRTYEGPLPPMPPIPVHAEGEEGFDQVSDLQSLRLRAMRSGQSLRQRSNSTPSQSQSQSQSHSRHMSVVSSYQSSERPMSNGSGVFPYWAKQYYGHGVALMSASKVSLTLPTPPRTAYPAPSHQQYQHHFLTPQHARGESEWTDVTTNSRIQSSYMDYYDTDSPPSSHFLPSIFRPRTRTRLNQTDSEQSLSINRSGQSQYSSSHPSSNQLSGHPHSSGSIALGSVPYIPQDNSIYTLNHPQPIRPEYSLSREASSPTYPTIPRTRVQPQSTIRTVTPPQPPFELPGDNYHHHHHPLPQLPSNQTNLRSSSSPDPTQNVRDANPVNVVPHAFFQLNSVPHLHPTKRTVAQGLSPWRAPSFTGSLDSLVRSKGNRQILLFVLGFICPLFWILGAVLPVPDIAAFDADDEKAAAALVEGLPSGVMSPAPPPVVPFAGGFPARAAGDLSAAQSLYGASLEDVRVSGALPGRFPAATGITGGGAAGDRTGRGISSAGDALFRPDSRDSGITGVGGEQDFHGGEARQRNVDTAEQELALLMMLQHQAEQEAQAARWAAEKVHLKARWWRTLNRIMSVVGVGIVGAIVALAVVAGLH